MQRWTLREATPDDANQVTEFARRVWDEYHRDQGHDLETNWSSEPVELFARDAGGDIVGLASGDIAAGVGHLSELLVSEAARGTGLGTELLVAFEARCWAAGYHKLTLHTESDGPARPFYERRGWRLEAVLRRDKAEMDFARLVKFRDNSTFRGK